MRFAGRRRRFSSWFGIVVGVRLVALVGAAARGAAIATVQSNIITGPDDDPVKNIVGAESAGDRAGVGRFTKILFGVDYFTGRTCPQAKWRRCRST